ncbi:MAG: restriction endonuclease subunit S [Bacteroidia bacterium]|nr:restriction endonuclease subunit S [Bacteroidia bacterium]
MSWEKVKLGTLINICTGKLDANASDPFGQYPFFTCAVAPLRINKYSFDCECVLVAGNGDLNVKYYLGKFDVYQRTYIIEAKNKDKLNTRYLFYILDNYLETLRELSIGGVIKYIKLNNLADPIISLPPLSIQEHIVSVLDHANNICNLKKQLLQKYDELAQSVFLEMFGDPVRNEKGWDMVHFDDVYDSRLGKMLDAKKQTGSNTFKYLGNSNLQWGRFELSNLPEMDFDEKDRKTFELKYGDLLICEGGEVGRTAIWKEELQNIYFQKAIHRARPKCENIIAEYTLMLMWFYAKKGGFKDYVSTSTISHLTGEKLKSMKIPLPPLSLQKSFQRVCNNIENQKIQIENGIIKADYLFQSLMQRAFNGELCFEQDKFAQYELPRIIKKEKK